MAPYAKRKDTIPMSKKNKKSEKKRKEGLFFYLLGGKLFTSNIFTKNALLLGLIAVYSFFYVSNRYQYEKELVRIDRLTKRRNEIRNNLLVTRSEFAHRSRDTELMKELKKQKSDFSIDEENPIKTYIILDKSK